MIRVCSVRSGCESACVPFSIVPFSIVIPVSG